MPTLPKTPSLDELAPEVFGEHAESALLRLQGACVLIFESLKPPPSRPAEIGRALALDKSLAWKLHRLVSESVPSAIAQFVPGESGWNIFRRALATHAIPAPVMASFEEALAQYQTLVKLHGGDRTSMQMMLSTDGEPDRTQMSLRRAAFRAASFVAGLQARTQVQVFFLAPGSKPGMLDYVLVKAFVDVRRLRPHAPLVTTRPLVSKDSGIGQPVAVTEPVAPIPNGIDGPGIQEARELGLWREFCSEPLPQFVRTRMRASVLDYELADSPIGNTGAMTIVTAEIFRNLVPNTVGPGSQRADHAMQLRVPSKAAILDVIAHEDAFPRHTPTLAVYSEYRGEEFRIGAGRERFRIPGHEQVETLAGGLRSIPTPDVPRYSAIVSSVMQRLNWNPAQFQAYRARIEYPFMPCAVLMSHPLHPAADA